MLNSNYGEFATFKPIEFETFKPAFNDAGFLFKLSTRYALYVDISMFYRHDFHSILLGALSAKLGH